MTKTPTQILRGIADSDRLTAEKAIDAIEDLNSEELREFGDALNDIADLLVEARDRIDEAVDARESGVPKDERDEAREAAIEAITELVDKIEAVQIPEAFEALDLDRVGG